MTPTRTTAHFDKMSRNHIFHHRYEPFRHQPSLILQQDKTTGPFDFLNPTLARFQPTFMAEVSPNRSEDIHEFLASSQGPVQESPSVEFKWTSRNNRKGRHTIVVPPSSPTHQDQEIKCATPECTAHWRPVAHTLWLMLTYYPVWDISWCIAFSFTLGSAIWVLNGLLVFLPFVQPSWTFHNQVLVGGGVSAFVGATVFQIGGILLLLEAVNENREGCFGWTVEQIYQEHHGQNRPNVVYRFKPNLGACRHHHHNKKSLLGTPQSAAASPMRSDAESQVSGSKSQRSWSWCPSWYELKKHYIHGTCPG